MELALRRLQDQIREAFPPFSFDRNATSCTCDECTGIRDALRRKAWDEVPPEFLDFTCSPTLFEPEAFHAFLPAYMLRGLDDLGQKTVVLEFTVYSLCPSLPEEGEELDAHTWKENRLHDIERLMSPAQVAAIRVFLPFAAEHAANGHWLKEFVDPALERVWLAR